MIKRELLQGQSLTLLFKPPFTRTIEIMENHQRITKKMILGLCKTCVTGLCCRDGVEADLSEAKKIATLKLNIKKPWFQGLFYDKDLPSKWGLSTVVRDGRCVFQAKDYRCRIYKYRPNYCREFPLEFGTLPKLYHYLCEKPRHIKTAIKTHFQPRPKRLTINLTKRRFNQVPSL